jgi:hypothetical protein
MKFIFWLIKLGIYAFISFIATTYWKTFGWWFLVICSILLLIVETIINKRIDHVQKQQLLKKYPILKNLKKGQIISVELKSGEELTNLIYIDFNDYEILVSKQLEFNKEPEKIMEDIIDIRWIKLKKVKTLKILDVNR